MATASRELADRSMSNESGEKVDGPNTNEHGQGATNSDHVMTPIQPPIDPVTPARQTPTTGIRFRPKTSNSMESVIRSKLIGQTLSQPIKFTQTLIQIGYEPLPAVAGKTFFRKEAMFYPNIFKYMKYIYRQEGFFGFYRGFGCALMSNVICSYTATQVDQIFSLPNNQTTDENEIPTWNTCIAKTLRQVQNQSWGILVSHPFQVMFVRCVGQFVGRENIYSSFNFYQNIREIYEREGFGGFFVGLIPRWIAEISAIVLTHVAIHILRTNVSTQKEILSLFEALVGLIVPSLTYPWNLTSTVTMINRSGLKAATLPLTPVCAHWQDAYKYLRQTQQLKRGSQFFGRVATGFNGIPQSQLN